VPLGIVRTLDILSRKLSCVGSVLRIRRAFARAPLASSANYSWSGSPNVGKKTALIATFARGSVPKTALKIAEQLSDCGYSCNIIAASDALFQTDQHFPVMVRENLGYDFGSWSHAISVLDTAECDTVLLINDSIIPGPEFKTLINQLEAADARTIGVTESDQLRHHVQSYLMMFKGTLDRKHWTRIKAFERQQAIDYYEIMNFDDFGIRGLFPPVDKENPSLHRWRNFEQFFIKRSLIEGSVDVRPLENPPLYAIN